MANTKALQAAVDREGTIVVRVPGMYAMALCGCSPGPHPIRFVTNSSTTDFGRTAISLASCIFRHLERMVVLINEVPEKPIEFKTMGSLVLQSAFQAGFSGHREAVKIQSDLPGLSGAPAVD